MGRIIKLKNIQYSILMSDIRIKHKLKIVKMLIKNKIYKILHLEKEYRPQIKGKVQCQMKKSPYIKK